MANNQNQDDQNTKEFLMKMYEKCWENVTNAEDALWKVFASYTAVFAGLAIAKDMIGFFGFVLLVIIFSFIGMFTAINANSWFTRNMGMIANLEKIFVPERYLDKTIPKVWTQKKVPFINVEIWWIMFLLFPFVIISTFVALYGQLTAIQVYYALGTITAGSVLVLAYFRKMSKRYQDFVKQAPG